MEKMLLTSAGVTNPSIREALEGMLAKPIAESHALAVPTAGYGHPWVDPVRAHRFLSGGEPRTPMVGLGWASVGVLELTALPSVGPERWVPWVEAADVLLVNGGCARYLAHWMRESGLAERLPSLGDTVWVGLSAGSMVMTPRIGAEFVEWPDAPDDRTLGVVDFSIFPHLGMPPENLLADAERWAAGIGHPSYAIDDRTAIRVVGGEMDVVSEGEWRFFA